ncbi:MAG: ZIP family metal transporter [Candidatus Omnitrophica bacterium]|nr:ZIP family metal transporter [Candidatus Omnitrophota bacterium]
MTNLIGPLVLATAAGAAEFLGASLAIAPLRFSRRAILYLFGMSGGYMLTWSIADLMPLLIEHDPGLVTWILASYFGLYVIENLFASHAHLMPAEDPHGHALVDSWGGHKAVISNAACWAAVVGLFLHAFLDGAAIVASFTIHRSVGVLVFVAVMIHKVPEGSSLTSVLGAARQGRRVILTAAGSAVMTIAGGLAAGIIGIAQPQWAYPMLALSAGTFLFIGASNLIPATQKGESRSVVFSVLGGAVLFVLVSSLLSKTGFLHE